MCVIVCRRLKGDPYAGLKLQWNGYVFWISMSITDSKSTVLGIVDIDEMRAYGFTMNRKELIL
jgi:hypothetical protein